MPTYEYACSNGHRVEVTQRIDDPPPTTCERCGAKLRKVFHPAGIVFKGSGFYATDSRPTKKETKEKAPSGSGESTGSESGSGKGSGEGSGEGSQKKTEPTSGDKKTSEGKSST
ncbi:MAG TPA: FmdB family zinc ribbon protein [Actinomycetota bacterium]|nr:FmdB family zinc ribbon protein [Actinomycetota bacterium]